MTATTTRGRVPAGIVGSGNIGTDLMYKLMRSPVLEPRWMVGVDPGSPGLQRATDAGVEASADGVDWLLRQAERPGVIFEATSAAVHRLHAPRYAAEGIPTVDLTPAALGPLVVPSVNLDGLASATNVNMITCGGQATIPIVAAVSRVTSVAYAEIVATVASVSAGPGTRHNIDEFTRTTAAAIESVGGASRGKAIIVLNPAEPPLMMRDTIFCSVPDDVDQDAVRQSIVDMVAAVAEFVPGYRLRAEPQFDDGRVATFIEVEGAGDFLPPYAGNLDIMTAAATRVGEILAARVTAGA